MSASARLKFLKSRPNATMEKLNEQRKASSSSFGDKYADFWYPELDNNRNGYAIIRFLPFVKEGEKGEIETYSHLMNHMIPANPAAPMKGNSYIYEVCPRSIGEKCPICEHTNRLWKLKTTESEAVARKFGIQNKFFANVLIIKDPKNPENEGKVKKFRFGKAILNMIQAAAEPKPKYEGAPVPDPIDAFSLFDTGANFELIINLKSESGKQSQISYDKSNFMIPGPLSEDEDEVDRIINECVDLSEYEEHDKIKSYGEIKDRFEDHLGENIGAGFGGKYTPAATGSSAAASESKTMPRAEPEEKVSDFSPEAEQAEQALAAFADSEQEIEDDDIPF